MPNKESGPCHFPPELNDKAIGDLLLLLSREQQLAAWLEETRVAIDEIVLVDDLHQKLDLTTLKEY